MSPAAITSPTLQLPWVTLGPRSQGRNYGVTFRSEGLRLPRPEENCLDEFALALAAWADHAAGGGAEGFCCFFRLADEGSWLLARARFLGRGGLGTVAAANGLIVPGEWVAGGGVRWRALAARIPDPAGRGWTPTALEIETAEILRPEPARPPQAQPLDRLAHALLRHTLRIEAEAPQAPGELLGRLLDSAYAPDPAGGWCETGRLSRNGAFDPATAFDLIVHPPGDGPPSDDPGRRFARVAGDTVSWSDIPESPAHELWEELLEVALARPIRPAAHMGLSRLRWRREYAPVSPVELVRMIVQLASETLPDGEALDVLEALAKATTQLADRPALQEEARTGLALAFTDFLQDATPQTAARLVEGYLSKLNPQLGGVADYMISAETLERGLLRHLSAHAIAPLAQHGLVTGLAGRTLEEIRERPLSTPALTALLGELKPVVGARSPPSEGSVQLAAEALSQAADRLLHESGQDAELWAVFRHLFRRLLLDGGAGARLVMGGATMLAAIAAPNRSDTWTQAIGGLHAQMIETLNRGPDLESVIAGLHGALSAIARAERLGDAA